MQVHISKMTGKLDGFKAISTNTITNKFCVKMNQSQDPGQICPKCYSHGMLKSYRKNMQPSLQRNSDLLASRPLERDEIPTLLEAFLRINAHGELINRQHFENIIAIAEHNPHCNVAIWTKRKDIVGAVLAKRDKPKNLILVWSNPKIDAVIYKTPANFDRVFNNVSSEHKPDEQNCTGQQCKNCLLCYKFDTAKIIIEAVKFNGRTVKGKDL